MSAGAEGAPVRRLMAMADWHPDCYQRAAAYVTDHRGRLLVFDHLDVEAGTQVPGGGIQVGESAAAAVIRELAEEAGLESAVIVRKLGEAWNRSEPGDVPRGLEEQIQHAFHVSGGRATSVGSPSASDGEAVVEDRGECCG